MFINLGMSRSIYSKLYKKINEDLTNVIMNYVTYCHEYWINISKTVISKSFKNHNKPYEKSAKSLLARNYMNNFRMRKSRLYPWILNQEYNIFFEAELSMIDISNNNIKERLPILETFLVLTYDGGKIYKYDKSGRILFK